MSDLMSMSINDITNIFNDELNTFLNQLIHIATQLNIDKKDFNKISLSRRTLEQGMSINKSICIDMYAAFLFAHGHENFIENIKNRKYDYFYNLMETEEIQEDFKELLSIISTVSYSLSDDLKNDIFGYLENISVLSNIYAIKKIKK